MLEWRPGREGGVTSKMLWWVLHSISILLTPFLLLIVCICHLYCVILIKIISKVKKGGSKKKNLALWLGVLM